MTRFSIEMEARESRHEPAGYCANSGRISLRFLSRAQYDLPRNRWEPTDYGSNLSRLQDADSTRKRYQTDGRANEVGHDPSRTCNPFLHGFVATEELPRLWRGQNEGCKEKVALRRPSRKRDSIELTSFLFHMLVSLVLPSTRVAATTMKSQFITI